jgi:hypothetical protein
MGSHASGRRPPKSSLTGRISRLRSRKPQPPAPQDPHNAYYEAGWTDSWSHRHCFHEHRTLLEAACAAPRGPGWYVFAVEDGNPRQLKPSEDRIVNEFRFAHPPSNNSTNRRKHKAPSGSRGVGFGSRDARHGQVQAPAPESIA